MCIATFLKYPESLILKESAEAFLKSTEKETTQGIVKQKQWQFNIVAIVI